MVTNKPQGFLGRAWKRFKRVILGKSDPSYLAELVGDERCFDRAIAAQLGSPGVNSHGAQDSRKLDPVDQVSKESFPISDLPARFSSASLSLHPEKNLLHNRQVRQDKTVGQ